MRKLKRLQQGHNGFQFILESPVQEELSPVVFFDAGVSRQQGEGIKIGTHPHSGIGIITHYEGADLVHDDSGGHANVLPDGGLQWIQAGKGIWHQEQYRRKEGVEGPWELGIHQLWLQLPPQLEEADPEYQNLQPQETTVVGNVKVIAGSYGGATSRLKVPHDITYLDVKLSAGETFKLETPDGQRRGLVFPRRGSISVAGQTIPRGHMGILEEGEGELEVAAANTAQFVVIMVEPYHYPVLSQGGSVHTNSLSMRRGLEHISAIAPQRHSIL